MGLEAAGSGQHVSTRGMGGINRGQQWMEEATAWGRVERGSVDGSDGQVWPIDSQVLGSCLSSADYFGGKRIHFIRHILSNIANRGHSGWRKPRHGGGGEWGSGDGSDGQVWPIDSQVLGSCLSSADYFGGKQIHFIRRILSNMVFIWPI